MLAVVGRMTLPLGVVFALRQVARSLRGGSIQIV